MSGVSVSRGMLLIQTPAHSGGNSAVVSIDPGNDNVEVTYNFGSGSQTVEFNPSTICNIDYVGGSLGGDTFTDNTNIISREYGYGSGNNFTGGTSLNYVWFLGSSGGNSYSVQGASRISDVFEYGGTDTINNPSGGTVQVYYE